MRSILGYLQICKKTLWSLLLALIALPLGMNAVAQESAFGNKLKIQHEIEQMIHKIIGTQLTKGEYFVYAKVDMKEKAADTQAAESGNSEFDKVKELPFSPVKIEDEYLNRLFALSNGAKGLADFNLEVTLVFDERVPEAKRKLLTDVVSDRFQFNDSDRKLNVQSLSLVSEPVNQQQKLVLEKSKIESEKALLDLQEQKNKLELMKKEAELDEARRKLEESKKSQEVNVTNNVTAGGTEEKKEEKPKTIIDHLRDFQVLLFALVGGLFAIVVAFLVGGSLAKSLKPTAEAIEKIGAGLENAASKSAPAPAAAAPTASSSSSESSKPDSAQRMGASMMAGAHGGAGAPVDKSFEEFIEQVQEKLEVLGEEKNFAFYRAFSDLIENPDTLTYAVSILLTLDEEKAKTLLGNVSVDQVDRLREAMARQGALSEAKSVSKEALQEFYGRIAAEEFVDSPLMKLKDLTWLTKMNTDEMREFTISLDPELRPAFFACLTPGRVQSMIRSCTEAEQKTELIQSLKDLDEVTSDQIGRHRQSG